MYTLQAGTPTYAGTPPSRYTPSRYTLQAGNPLTGTPPGVGTPLGRYIPYQVHSPTGTPPGADKPWAGTTPPPMMVTAAKVLRILLECFLVD